VALTATIGGFGEISIVPNSYASEDAWNAACDEADRLDPGWRWDELRAKIVPLPPERDAIQISAAAIDLLPPPFQSSMINSDADIPRLVTGNTREMKWGDVPAAHRAGRNQFDLDFLAYPRRSRLTPPLLAALREAMTSANAARQQSLRLIGQSPGLFVPLKRPMMKNLPIDLAMRYRRLAGMLRFGAICAAEDGQPDVALDHCRAFASLTQAMARPPLLITALVSFAGQNILATAIARTLAISEPSSSALATMQEEIQTLLDAPVILEAMRGERTFVADKVTSLAEGILEQEDIDAMHRKFPLSLWKLKKWAFRKIFGGELAGNRSARELRFYTGVIELLKSSPDGPTIHPEEMKSLDKQSGFGLGETRRTTRMMLLTDRRQRAGMAAMVVALAAERFRNERGRWPNNQEELLPDYLHKLPCNPHTLEPMTYYRMPDGIEIEARGRDWISMGGIIPYLRGRQRGDVKLRLWNPELRRQSG